MKSIADVVAQAGAALEAEMESFIDRESRTRVRVVEGLMGDYRGGTVGPVAREAIRDRVRTECLAALSSGLQALISPIIATAFKNVKDNSPCR